MWAYEGNGAEFGGGLKGKQGGGHKYVWGGRLGVLVMREKEIYRLILTMNMAYICMIEACYLLASDV